MPSQSPAATDQRDRIHPYEAHDTVRGPVWVLIYLYPFRALQFHVVEVADAPFVCRSAGHCHGGSRDPDVGIVCASSRGRIGIAAPASPAAALMEVCKLSHADSVAAIGPRTPTHGSLGATRRSPRIRDDRTEKMKWFRINKTKDCGRACLHRAATGLAPGCRQGVVATFRRKPGRQTVGLVCARPTFPTH